MWWASGVFLGLFELRIFGFRCSDFFPVSGSWSLRLRLGASVPGFLALSAVSRGMGGHPLVNPPNRVRLLVNCSRPIRVWTP